MTISTITNKDQINEFISNLGNNYLCMPFLTSDTLIVEFLKSKSGNIGHPTNDGNLIVKYNSNFYKFKKPDDITFKNNISSTEAAIRVRESINAIKDYNTLQSVLGFSKEQIDSINIVIVDKPKIISNESTFFMITFKNGKQYLDFVSWDINGNSCNYSGKHSHGLSHSGDKSYNSYFMQSIKCNNSRDTHDFILGGIGYQTTELMNETYKDQKPCMCYYDQTTNTIGVLPFQQTQSILGHSTTIACGVVKYLPNSKLNVIPLTCVPNSAKYNTSNKITCDLPNRCINGANEILTTIAEAEAEATEATEATEVETNEEVNGTNSISNDTFQSSTGEEYDIVDQSDAVKVIQYSNDPSIIMDIDNSLKLDYLGNSEIGLNNKYNPSLFGETNKNAYNGSLTPALNLVKNFNTKYLDCLNIMHINNNHPLPEECASLINTKITCLMIINANVSSEDIINTLENINLSCTKYANHLSIILVKCVNTGIYYWIRGIRWYHEKIYKFGDVFDKSELNVILTEPITPYQVVTNNIYFKKNDISINDAESIISNMNYTECIENQNDIIELFVQLSILQTDETFNTFKHKCLDIITIKQNENNKTYKSKIIKLIQKQNDGANFLEIKKEIDAIKSNIKKSRACSVLNNLTQSILGITSDGGASTKAASKSLQSSIRGFAIKKNTYEVNSMTQEDICEYLEDFDSFVIGQLVVNQELIDMLNSVSNETYTGSNEHIMDIHKTCNELDGFTVSALIEHSAKVNHELNGGGVAMLCGESEHVSSVAIAILSIFTDIKDPRYFKWFDEVNNINIAKFRILLRRMICEATINRDRNIKPSSKSLTYFLIAMFISLAQSIRKRVSKLPTDESDFTVLAMRNLVGYIFTMCASGTAPITNIWKVLSHYPTKVPGIDAFEIKDFWILQNLIDMFPYCMWSIAEPNFKKNTLIGLTKLLGKYIITKELEKIDDEEKKQLAIKSKEISKDLTIIWQWQKLVIISIVNILIKQNKDEAYYPSFIKYVAKCLLESYPDIDESMISFKHKKSNSSDKLKNMLKAMKKHGNIKLKEHQLNTVRCIISKRMHAYYYKLCKDGRTKYFNTLDINGIHKELNKLNENESESGPSNKYIKSWCLNNSFILSNTEFSTKINSLFISANGDANGNDNGNHGNVGANNGGADSDNANDDANANDGNGGSDNANGSKLIIKYPDMREELWVSYNDNLKMMKFIETHKLKDMVSIMEYIFPDQNVYDIIIDISGILLDNYKDRTTAYEIVVDKYTN